MPRGEPTTGSCSQDWPLDQSIRTVGSAAPEAVTGTTPAGEEVSRVYLGVDGFMTTYNYRRACACVHCQDAFRAHLKRTFTPQELAHHHRGLGLDDPLAGIAASSPR